MFFNYRFAKLENEIKQLTIPSVSKSIILTRYTQRWKKMYHPAIIVAYYLDPRYRGHALSEEYPFLTIAEEVSKFVNQNSSGQLIRELLWYNNKTGLFGKSIFWELEALNNPINWWNGLRKEVPILGKLAIKLMSIPASTASSECNWSNFGFIQNIKRNRLTNERTFRLVSIYANLRLINGQKLNDINIEDDDEQNQLELEMKSMGETENENEVILVEESDESKIDNL